MKLINRNQAGFTIVEIAIVLVVVTVLLGYTVALFPVQQELKQYRQANAEIDEIIDALIAFAQVNGRLPCPATAAGADGFEDRTDLIDNVTGAVGGDGEPDNCSAMFGFIPSGTLGINGNVNANGVLQDPWGGGYGYAISDIDAGGAFGVDLVTTNGIRDEGIPAYNINPPDLFICDNSTVLGNHLNCAATTGGNPVATNVAAVIISLGKDFNLGGGSNIQQENFDDFDDGTNDKVYISTTRSDSAGAEYDDIVKWISPNILFSKMIEADQLP